MPFSLYIRIRRHCIEELGYFSPIAFHASCLYGCCLELGLPAKRTRKLLAVSLVHNNKTVKLLVVGVLSH